MFKLKICWISNAPSPYKVDFMNVLGTKVDLYCLFETHAEKDRQIDWYKSEFNTFHAIFLDRHNTPSVLAEMAQKCDLLINSDYTKQICRKALHLFHKQKKPVLLHADGGLVKPRGPLDRIISHFMKQNDWFLSSGEITDCYFKYYGCNEERLLHYHFACASTRELCENHVLSSNRIQMRKKCGCKEEFILFSVGQQIPRKGYDLLAQAMVDLPRNIGLYIAGGAAQPEVESILKKNHLDNIHFIGFKSHDELREWYAAADIFVLPTRYDIWGLVINEAMSFGLPIISTDHCVAALHFNKHCNNALIVPINDPKVLSDSITHLLTNESERNDKGTSSYTEIQKYNYDQMCSDFLKCFSYVLDQH